MSLLTKAALLLAVAGSALGAPTLTNPGGFKTHVSAAGTTHHIPGHGTHFELPDHLKQRSIPGGGEIESTRRPEQQAPSQTMYTNHTYIPAEAFNRTATVTKRSLQALTGGDANGDEKQHIAMPHASSVPFVDPATGISFQRFYDETSQFSFGLALSSLPSGDDAANNATDFIGQLSFPLNATSGLGRGAGWGGISISPKLTASHLPLFLGLQTDGFGNLAFSSFTEAVKSAASGATTEVPTTVGQQAASIGKDLAFKIRTIPSATSISTTNLTYTFLCEGCLSIGKCAANLEAWKAQGKTKVLRLGWATGDAVASEEAKADAETQTAADAQNAKTWAYHRLGFGHLKIDLEGALSHTAEQFNGWKALAVAEEVKGFEGLAPPFAMDLVNGFSNSEGAKNLEKVKGEEGEKKEEEGEKGVESESDSDSDSDSDCGCESDNDSDSDSESEDEE